MPPKEALWFAYEPNPCPSGILGPEKGATGDDCAARENGTDGARCPDVDLTGLECVWGKGRPRLIELDGRSGDTSSDDVLDGVDPPRRLRLDVLCSSSEAMMKARGHAILISVPRSVLSSHRAPSP